MFAESVHCKIGVAKGIQKGRSTKV